MYGITIILEMPERLIHMSKSCVKRWVKKVTALKPSGAWAISLKCELSHKLKLVHTGMEISDGQTFD